MAQSPHFGANFSMWARMKSEFLYDRYDTEKMLVEDVKVLIWRYFISYWNNRRNCSDNDGLPPEVKRQRYYDALAIKFANPSHLHQTDFTF